MGLMGRVACSIKAMNPKQDHVPQAKEEINVIFRGFKDAQLYFLPHPISNCLFGHGRSQMDQGE